MDPIALTFLAIMLLLIVAAIIIPQIQNRQK